MLLCFSMFMSVNKRPKIKILNSLEDTLKKKDSQLEWIKLEIEKEKSGK